MQQAYDLADYLEILAEISLSLMQVEVIEGRCLRYIKKMFQKFAALPFHEDLIKCNLKQLDRIGIIYTFLFNRSELGIDVSNILPIFKSIISENQALIAREQTDMSKMITHYVCKDFILFEDEVAIQPLATQLFFVFKAENIKTLKTAAFLGKIQEQALLEKLAYYSLYQQDWDTFLQLHSIKMQILPQNIVEKVVDQASQLTIPSLLLLLNHK